MTEWIDIIMINQIALIIAAAIWIYAILRTARDISARTQSAGLQALSVIMILLLTPIIGIPLYFLIRPQSTLRDDFWKQQLAQQGISCVFCWERNAKEFEFCTFCGEKLKQNCKQCKKPYALSYEYCPFCGGPNIDVVASE